MGEKRIINLDDLTTSQVGDGKGFSVRWGQAGPLIGSTGIGCSVLIVPPGKSACPFHRHHVSDELFVILDGEGVTRLDGATLPIRAGDIIAAPPARKRTRSSIPAERTFATSRCPRRARPTSLNTPTPARSPSTPG